MRALLGSTRGSGQSAKISRHGNYALHGKMYVFDRKKILIGSMNFDQRSQHINTEIGIIIGSPDIALQTAQRFENMVKPENCYALALSAEGAAGKSRLTWHTQENSRGVEFLREPARSGWQRLQARLLGLLPLEREL